MDDPDRGLGVRDGDDPATPTPGLTPWELAEWVEDFCAYATSRILGVGAHQYDNVGRQKFEDMPLGQLCIEIEDEIADLINYSAMLALRIRWIKKAVETYDPEGPF